MRKCLPANSVYCHETNKVREENKIQIMKTLIFFENVLILEEDKKQSEEKLNRLNLIIKNVD